MDQKKYVFRFLILILVTTSGLYGNLSLAQQSRSLSGEIKLDIAPAFRDLIVEISVRNHGFAVLPPPFGIVRPIRSRVTTRAIIPKGQSGAQYSLAGINPNPVDYTISVVCIRCADIIQTQYYSPNGNRFGLVNSVFIDPDDLPELLDLEAITQGAITGLITTAKPASKDIQFRLDIVRDQTPETIIASEPFLLQKGAQSINYEISGLPRSSGTMLARLQCLDCLGKARRKLIFARSLDSDANHENINFLELNEGVANMAPIIRLLLNEGD